MEGGSGFPFGGDPDDLMRGLREFAERQTEAMQEIAARAVRDADAQHRGGADRGGAQAISGEGSPDEQAIALRDAMRVLFPEAVALVSAARQGFMRESG